MIKLNTLHRIFFTYFCPTFYGGSPPSSPSTTTQNVNNIPSQLMPYVKTMMGAAENQVYTKDASGKVTGFQPYKPYSNNAADYVAQFSPLQQQAQQGAANMQMPGQFGVGTGLTAAGGLGQFNTAGQAQNVGVQGGLGYGAMGAGYGAQSVQAGQGLQNTLTNPNAMAQYMNPYIENALNPALQLQNQSFGMKGAEQQSNATRSGAFGGSREALMNSLNSQSNAMANQQMIGTAYNNAYTNAQQAANQANQAQLQGLQQGMQGAGVGLQGVGQALQGIQGAQAGYAGAVNAGSALGQLGTQQLAADTSILGTQSAFGGQQQQQQQQAIDQAVLNWQNAQQQPYMQLGTMSNLIRGIPTGNSTQTQYMAQPSMFSQLGGLAASGIGAYGALKAEGGPIKDKGYARGGIVGYSGENSSVVSSVEAQLNDMDDVHLQDTIQNSSSQSIKELAIRILNERKASNMANGGIVKFANNEDKVRDRYKDLDTEDYFFDTNQPQTAITAAAPAPAPVNTTPTPNPQAITAAIPSTVPVISKTQQPNPQPIIQGTPATAQNTKDLLSPLREDVKTAQTEADKSIAERIDEQRKLEEKYVGKDVGAEEYRNSLKEEKEKAPDEARRMMYMRLMEFGANWGSTPGAPLVAGMQALKQTLPNVITDKKEQKSTMRTIDKAIYEVNHADYLEKKGQVKEASILKQRASERIMDEHKTLVDAGLKQLELESKERQNREDNTTRIQAAKIQEGAYGSHNKALTDNQTRQELDTRIKAIDTYLADPTKNIPANQEEIKNLVWQKTQYLNKLRDLSPSLNIGDYPGADSGGSTFDFSKADKIVGIK